MSMKRKKEGKRLYRHPKQTNPRLEPALETTREYMFDTRAGTLACLLLSACVILQNLNYLRGQAGACYAAPTRGPSVNAQSQAHSLSLSLPVPLFLVSELIASCSQTAAVQISGNFKFITPLWE